MRGWMLVVVALVVAIGGYAAMKQVTKRPAITTSKPAPAAIVTTEAAAYRMIDAGLTITGSVAAKDPLSVGAEANGLRIEQVPVEEGDVVQRGQLLARLNSSVLEAQRAALQARYDSSQAQVRKAIQPNRPQDIAGLALAVQAADATVNMEIANLRQAQSSLENAEKNVARYRDSLSQGYVTAQETETRFTEADRQRAAVQMSRERIENAKFQADQARQRLQLAKLGGRSEDVEIARATSQEIAAQIAQIDAQIDQTRVVAPDSGLITRRDAHIGDISSPSKVLFQIVRQDQLELKAQIPEVELPRLRVGQVAVLDFNGKKLKGRVWQVSPSVDPDTRLGEARILLPLHSGLKTGMFVGGSLEMGTRRALTIPARAMSAESGRQFVLTVNPDNRVQRRTITTGIRSGDRVEVLSGLEVGEMIVVEGAGFLNDGDLIQTAAKKP